MAENNTSTEAAEMSTLRDRGSKKAAEEVEHRESMPVDKLNYPEVSAGSGASAVREGAQAKVVHNVCLIFKY